MKHSLSYILVVNGGSSSIKFSLFDTSRSYEPILRGKIENIGAADAALHVHGLSTEDTFSRKISARDHQAAAALLGDWIEKRCEHIPLAAIGHRIVHGGSRYWQPEKITQEVIQELDTWRSFEPRHLPGQLSLIEVFTLRFPNLLQIACFDTAFHHDLPRVAQMVPIPRYFATTGVRRYGFHGLSCEFLMEELRRLEGTAKAQGRIILAHLGNGASLTAVLQGKSVDTSMGLTPAAGIPMSTRSGDLDPGIIQYLQQTQQFDIKKFHQMVNFESGLLGISETTGDVRELLRKEVEDPRAEEALGLFCYQIKKTIGALAAALNGLDFLVFSGGIGENLPIIRSRICKGLDFLGIELEEKSNKANAEVLSSKNSKVTIRLIHTDEEMVIAKTVFSFLS